MSIPDDLIVNYFNYATMVTPDEIEKLKTELATGVNPKFIKQRLAREIVGLYHGSDVAVSSEEEFNKIFSQREIPTDIAEYKISGEIWIVKLLTDSGMTESNSEARRMIKQGAVYIDNEKVVDENLILNFSGEKVIKVGKRKFVKVVVGQ